MKIRVYIADADSGHAAGVCKALSKRKDFEIVGVTVNGGVALKQLPLFQPDVLLTDIQLPEVDGLALLHRARGMRMPPVGIVCTRFYSDLSVEYACRSGASFVLYKPLDFDRLPDIIAECCRSVRGAQAENNYGRENARQRDTVAVRALLRDLGLPSHLTGTLYITEAVLLLRDNRVLIRNMSQGLYAEIAKRTDASPARIERALRNAISIAYERGALKRYFGYRPANREFIEFIARQLDQTEEESITSDMQNP